MIEVETIGRNGKLGGDPPAALSDILPPGTTPITASAMFVMDFEPPEQLIDGVLHVGASLLVSKPKVGKSIFALNERGFNNLRHVPRIQDNHGSTLHSPLVCRLKQRVRRPSYIRATLRSFSYILSLVIEPGQTGTAKQAHLASGYRSVLLLMVAALPSNPPINGSVFSLRTATVKMLVVLS